MYIDVLIDKIISKEGVNEYIIYKCLTNEIYSEIDEYRQTILELAVERNYVEVVELILNVRNPAYRDDWIGDDFISLMPLIYRAKDREYKNIVKVLRERYEGGAKSSINLRNQASLISAIRNRQKGTIMFFILLILFVFQYYCFSPLTNPNPKIKLNLLTTLI